MRFKASLVWMLFPAVGPVFADSGMTIGYTMHATVTTSGQYQGNFGKDQESSSETFVWTGTVTDTWPNVENKSGSYTAFFGPGTGINSSVGGSGSWSRTGDCPGQASWEYKLAADPESLPLPVFGAVVILTGPVNMYAIAPPLPPFGFQISGQWKDCTSSAVIDHPYSLYGGGHARSDYYSLKSKFNALFNGTFDPNKGNSASQSASFTFDHSDSSLACCREAMVTTIEVVVTLTWGPTPPPPPSVKDDDSCCKESGHSIIGAQDQSLGQTVAIAGTPFELHYQSDRLPGRMGDTATWTAKNLAMGGWSFDVHHAYDPKAGVLYLGSGERRSGDSAQPVPTADSGFLIPSQDESLIYQFDPSGRHIRTLDEFTGTALYEFVYDGQGRLTGIQDDAGNRTNIERNGDQPTAIAGPFGHRTTLSADANGYLAEIQAPDGAVTALTYNAEGLMSTFTDPRGNVHQFTFDSSGRITRDVGPQGDSQTLTRMGVDNGYAVRRTTSDGLNTVYTVLNPTTNPTFQTQFPDGSRTTGSKAGPFFNTVTDVAGTATTVDYGQDPRWGLQAALPKNFSTITPGGLASSGTLDRTVLLSDPSNPLSLSGLQDTTQLNGRTYRTEYAASNRTLTKTSPAGRQLITTLDAQGRTAAWQRNGLAPFQFTYDSQGRLSAVTTGDGDQQRTQNYEYGTDGLLNRFTDALGQVTSYQRDKAGRVVSQILPDKRVIAFGYDASGNLTSITPPERPAHTFRFTPVDLTSAYVPPMVPDSGMPTSFLWNSEKDLWQITRSDGGVVRWNFDALGRVASLDFPTGRLSYTYDNKTGKTTQIADADGNSLSYSYDGDLLLANTWSGPVNGQVQRIYDSDFRLASVAVNGGDPVTIGYDEDGYVVSAGDMTVTRDATTGLISGTSLDRVTDSLAYNVFGELTQYAASGPAGALMAVSYTRDKLGRITDKSETIGGATSTWHYAYDAAGGLTSVDKDGAAVARYTYDANGNRTRVTASGANEDSTYDDQDRLTQRGTAPYQYARSGELASRTVAGQKTQYEYDALGNLRRVLLASGKEIRYVVDGENQRTGKKVNGTLVQGFLYLDNLRPVAELDGAGNLVSLFVYGQDEGAPLYLAKGGVKYRIFTDHLGSPRLVVNAATGEIAQRIDYDAFGRVTADTSPGFQPFGFAGGLYDPDTGLVRFGARDYDADVGRWTAKDPVLFDGGDTNLYGYAGNDPVNRTDRRGTTCYGTAGGPCVVTPPLPPEPLAPLEPLVPLKAPKPPCDSNKKKAPRKIPVIDWGKRSGRSAGTQIKVVR